MKRPSLVVLIIVCLIVFFTTITGGILLAMRNFGSAGLFDPAQYINKISALLDKYSQVNFIPGWGQAYEFDETRNLDLTDVDAVEIITVSEDLVVTTGDNAFAHLSGSYRTFGAKLEWVTEKTGSTLSIHTRYPRVGMLRSNLNLAVQIPASFTGSVKITTVSASCVLSDDVACLWKKLDINSVSGKIDVARGEFGEMSFGTVSGSVKIDQLNAPLSGKTVSGAINLSFRIFHAATLNTVSGAVRVDLPSDAQGNFEFSSVSGNFRNDGMPLSQESQKNRKFSGTFGQGGDMLRVQTTSGNLVMNQH